METVRTGWDVDSGSGGFSGGGRSGFGVDSSVSGGLKIYSVS